MPAIRPEARHQEATARRVQAFGRRFGKAHLKFARHAAFPLALSADLLSHLWVNFQHDVNGHVLNIPWVAIADLLLSDLCTPVGSDLFEMNPAARNILLAELAADPVFGQGRLDALAAFVQQYVEQQLNSEDPYVQDLARMQRWAALAYSRPKEAAEGLAAALRAGIDQGDSAEQIRLAAVVDALAEPLAGYGTLLAYARARRSLAQGLPPTPAEVQQASQAVPEARRVGDVLLPPIGDKLPQPRPADPREDHLRSARLALSKSELVQAVEAIQAALAVAPGDAEAMSLLDQALRSLYRQGRQALEQGKAREALNLLQRVQRLQPDYQDTAELVARVQTVLKALEDLGSPALAEAKKEWERTLAKVQKLREALVIELSPVLRLEIELALKAAEEECDSIEKRIEALQTSQFRSAMQAADAEKREEVPSPAGPRAPTEAEAPGRPAIQFWLRSLEQDKLEISIFRPGGGVPRRMFPRSRAELAEITAAIRSGLRSRDKELVIRSGRRLYDAVFQAVSQVEREVVAARQDPNRPDLHFIFEEEALEGVPWESLRDGESFLALDPRVTLTRYLAPPKAELPPSAPPPGALPLKVLAASAVAEGFPGSTRLFDALREDRGVELFRLDRASLADLNNSLKSRQPQVLCFTGHSRIDADGRAELALEGQDGITWVGQSVFRNIGDASALQLAVLIPDEAVNESAAQASVRLAQEWLRQGLASVVTLQFAISDKAIVTFVREFFRAVAAGRTVAKALSLARQAMALKITDSLEWAAPVLYTRVPDHPLITAQPAAATTPDVATLPNEPAEPAGPQPPSGQTWTLGFDASSWQGKIDWPTVARDPSGVRFVFIRATQGARVLDTSFEANWEQARSAGLRRGVYHVYNFNDDALRQAEFLLKTIGARLKPDDMPPAVDVEPPRSEKTGATKKRSGAASARRVADLRRFLERVEEKTGRKPIIYTSAAAWKDVTGDDDSFDAYPLWVAYWNAPQPVLPAADWGGRSWTFWQFSSEGVLATLGNAAPVDLNWYRGTLEEMQAEFGPRPAPPPRPSYTNQEVINAFSGVANELSGNLVNLLRKAGLEKVIHQRSAPYIGPDMDQLPGLDAHTRQALKMALKGGQQQAEPVCPFIGPCPYTEAEADAFFGREAMVSRLLEHLTKSRLVVLAGPAGSGRTSLVQAGLMPALKQGALPDSREWLYLPAFTPGEWPSQALQAALDEFAGQVPGAMDQFSGKQDPLPVERQRRLASMLLQQRWLMIIDQLEEVFTLAADEHQRRAFAHTLMGLIDNLEGQYRVVVIIGADYVDRLAQLLGSRAVRNESLVRLTGWTPQDLQETMVRPAQLAALAFEPGLAEALAQDVVDEPDAPFLLQIALVKLWEMREGNRLTLDAYKRLGGAREAPAVYADEVLDQLAPADRSLAQTLLQAIVQMDERGEPVCRRVRVADLMTSRGLRPILEKLVDAHLVRQTIGPAPGEMQVEMVNEALVRRWPTLMRWLREAPNSEARNVHVVTTGPIVTGGDRTSSVKQPAPRSARKK